MQEIQGLWQSGSANRLLKKWLWKGGAGVGWVWSRKKISSIVVWYCKMVWHGKMVCYGKMVWYGWSGAARRSGPAQGSRHSISGALDDDECSHVWWNAWRWKNLYFVNFGCKISGFAGSSWTMQISVFIPFRNVSPIGWYVENALQFHVEEGRSCARGKLSGCQIQFPESRTIFTFRRNLKEAAKTFRWSAKSNFETRSQNQSEAVWLE